jgi:hypothetical protein
LGGLCFLAASAVSASSALAVDSTVELEHWGRRPANLFAVVDLAGTLLHGNGVSSVAHLATGQYEVTFTREVGQCAYVATTVNAYSQALQAYTAGGHSSTRGVYVETKNQGGGLTDGPFHLLVVCDGAGTKYAVVGYGAELVRATRGTTLTALGSGRYEVKFPHRFGDWADSCAYLATVGDPDSALVFNPSGVYTGSGPDYRTVYIETKNPGGGLQDGVPFHLAVVCASAPQTRIAVVQANGIPSRSSLFTSALNSSTGNYAVATNRDITECATVATRGSVDQAVPFSPTTVEIVPGPGPNTVGIQERELLFFGGNLFNEAFHTATVCK